MWTPDEEVVRKSNLKRFMESHDLKSLDDFLSYSLTEAFWGEFAKSIKIPWFSPFSKVLDTSQGIQWAKWFIGGKFNLGNIPDTNGYVRWEDEEGNKGSISYSEMASKAKSVASWLKRNGLEKGDRVGVYMSYSKDLLPVVFGIARAGGVIVPLFSGFGPELMRVRLDDVGAKFLFSTDGNIRKGKIIRMIDNAREAFSGKIIVHDRLGLDKENPQLSEVYKTGGDYIEETSAEDVLMVIYTSGTTGKPKGTVHVHAGFPIKAAADGYFHFDIKESDVITWMSDFGWMMGPWVIFNAITLGSSIFLFDGTPKDLWEVVDYHKVSVLGLSPTLIRMQKSLGKPRMQNPPRIVGSTGEPLDESSWRYIVDNLNTPLINYSGGTEISGGILGCYVVKDIAPASFNGPSPGMKVDVLDEELRPVRGSEGYLSVLAPWPGMTRGFWRNPQKYIETYWRGDVWIHGDMAIFDGKFYYITGRSDDVIKVAGKRLGPGEIEAIVNTHVDVVESACIGVPDPVKGEVPICFVVSKGNSTPEEIRKYVEDKIGKPLAPKEVIFVRSLPKTRNAKILRRLIKRIYLGQEIGDSTSLENPDSVEEIKRAANPSTGRQ
ncbi:AMP-dependent synthetase [Sulfolobales archaeon HS-7]|nr:AMP-dependent synthetase [Sulfolobales archaeon HS-7]